MKGGGGLRQDESAHVWEFFLRTSRRDSTALLPRGLVGGYEGLMRGGERDGEGRGRQSVPSAKRLLADVAAVAGRVCGVSH